eukprot:gnl/Hemi2/12372_TR4227_c0_g23_i1.p1 gnl/Hemi2/12372_TR4227_c0_g23~~gnl/Hemi2/12372_TR4227_c0_g23_i1.p1  ORF type:complete len:172 (-),score=28.78 gnl/Hemi2/12372_TR4227_c0_g23_i1:151-666(-)
MLSLSLSLSLSLFTLVRCVFFLSQAYAPVYPTASTPFDYDIEKGTGLADSAVKLAPRADAAFTKAPANSEPEDKWPIGFFEQFWLLSLRSFKEKKGLTFDAIGLFQTVVLALICGMLWWQTSTTFRWSEECFRRSETQAATDSLPISAPSLSVNSQSGLCTRLALVASAIG